MLLAACARREEANAPPLPPAPPSAARDALAAHSAEFRREVVRVTERVHVAVGYGLANSILIRGEGGVIVVDTLESLEGAREVREAFRKIDPAPVAAIVYTHNHADHVFGSPAFADDPAAPPPVYAHETTSALIDEIASVTRPVLYRRSMRMFGTHLPRDLVLNAGIGPSLETGPGRGTLGLLRPTQTFEDRLALTIAGVELELVHAPGETDDQLFVWLPQERVLLPGDNFYRSFPNLYTIRGTSHRDTLKWVASLDAMRDLAPAHLVPSHTRPLSGETEITAALTDYRDAIQFVHDQTLRRMNRGESPDQIASELALPPHLAASPYLQPYYGTVEWSIRAIFAGYLGWFDGNAAHLSPLAPSEHAQRLAALAQSGKTLAAAAADALAAQDLRWAAELADQALALDPDDASTRETLATALRALGEAHPSANGRHYYLTQALETEGQVQVSDPDPAEFPLDLLHGLPLAAFFRGMTVALDAGRSADVDLCAGFRFPDTGEAWTLHVRRGVAEIRPRFPSDPDFTLVVDSNTWKEVLTGRRNPALAFATREVKLEGSLPDLLAFLRLFDPQG